MFRCKATAAGLSRVHTRVQQVLSDAKHQVSDAEYSLPLAEVLVQFNNTGRQSLTSYWLATVPAGCTTKRWLHHLTNAYLFLLGTILSIKYLILERPKTLLLAQSCSQCRQTRTGWLDTNARLETATKHDSTAFATVPTRILWLPDTLWTCGKQAGR